MRVGFAPSARLDLREIAQFIALDNPYRAETFYLELETACLALSDMAERFPLVGRFTSRGLRRRPYKGYSIFYVVEHEEVRVVRILSDYAALETPTDGD